MEKEKKVVKKPVKAEKAPVKEKKVVTAKSVKPQEVEPKAEVKATEKPVEKIERKGATLNQDLNIMVGVFSLLIIVSFCFAFQGGNSEILGWELLLKSGAYSGVFKGIMIIYVISLFIDCLLTVNINSDNETIDLVEKVLYMFTLTVNIVINAILFSLINKIGIGLIIFLIASIISGIIKLARIYSRK